jgi:DNA-binding HxlR family transcriptional regulator
MGSMRRSYGQYCGIARSLDVVGDRWALLLVRELLYLGPRRFRDLRAALPGLAPNLLTRRLRELERAGVVARSQLPDPARVPVYRLTRRGSALEPVLRALLQWGRPLLEDPRGQAPLRVALPVMALGALFRPEDAADVAAVFELRVEGQVFQAVVADGRLELLVGGQRPPDAVATVDAATLADVAAGRTEALDALAAGTLRLEGEPDALAAFVRIFGHNPDLRLPG